jgi:hypothetical protein
VVRGSLELRGNRALVMVNGLRLLQQVGDTLLVSGSGQLEDFSFLAAVEQARSLVVSETGLRDGTPFSRLIRKAPAFPGAIRITGNPKLTDVRFLAGLESVGSSLYLHQNRLAGIEGLEALERVGASFTLSANELTDLSPLAKLKQVNGVISLSANRLRSLHGLEGLERVRTANWNGTAISIKLNGNREADGRVCLTDISALANVKEAGGQLVIVADENHEYAGLPAQGSAYFTNTVDVVRQR